MSRKYMSAQALANEKAALAVKREEKAIERANTAGIVAYERYTRKQLGTDVPELTSRTMKWLKEGDRWETLLGETKLKDLSIILGILTDKMLLLEGQPTQIIGTPQQKQLDQIGQALQEVMQQRGLTKTVTLTQQTATIQLQPDLPKSV